MTLLAGFPAVEVFFSVFFTAVLVTIILCLSTFKDALDVTAESLLSVFLPHFTYHRLSSDDNVYACVIGAFGNMVDWNDEYSPTKIKILF